jgi:hypothetical protein
MGLLVFNSLTEAIRAGYQVYERTENGFLVRTHAHGTWRLAIVDCRQV